MTLPEVAAAPRRGNWWPWIVPGLLLLQLGMSSLTVYFAVSDPSFATEPDYYRRAQAWDDTAAQRRAAHELGWSLELATPLPLLDSADLPVHLTLRDAAGAPIADAEVDAEVFHHARAAERQQLIFVRQESGYASTLPAARPGAWEFRLRIRSAAHAVLATQIIEIPAPGEARR